MIPVFASIPSPEISFIDLGPVRIHFYALFIIAGIVLALLIGNTRLKARGARGGEVLDISLWAVPIGLVGARLFHVLSHWDDYVGPNKDPLAILRIWEGGIAIYGALIFGIFGAWVGCRFSGIRLPSYADAIAPGLLLAQGIGRIGNYFNNELFGQPTNLPWGLEISQANPAYPIGLPIGVTFHPTFAYEMLWNFIGVGLLLLIDRKLKLRWGRLFGVYLVIYSFGRYWIEGLRIDPSDIYFGLRTNQWMAVAGIVLGIAIFLIQNRRHPGLEESVYLPGREPEGEAVEEPVIEEDSGLNLKKSSASKAE